MTAAKPDDKDGIAWLVERPGPEWLSIIEPPYQSCWTTDLNKAIRFSIKEAADKIANVRWKGFEEAKATEHLWCAPLPECGAPESQALTFFIAQCFADGYFDDERDIAMKERIRAWLLTEAEKIPEDITIQEVIEKIIGPAVQSATGASYKKVVGDDEARYCPHGWDTRLECGKCRASADTRKDADV